MKVSEQLRDISKELDGIHYQDRFEVVSEEREDFKTRNHMAPDTYPLPENFKTWTGDTGDSDWFQFYDNLNQKDWFLNVDNQLGKLAL